MDKEQLLAHLRNDVYCRVMPSRISGVGVFAIKDIPAGIDPFAEAIKHKWIPFREKELMELHPNVLKLLKDLLVLEDGAYWVPVRGMNTLSITQFLNHSESPNIDVDEEAEIFSTKREIKAGEELTIDYRRFDEAWDRF